MSLATFSEQDVLSPLHFLHSGHLLSTQVPTHIPVAVHARPLPQLVPSVTLAEQESLAALHFLQGVVQSPSLQIPSHLPAMQAVIPLHSFPQEPQ